MLLFKYSLTFLWNSHSASRLVTICWMKQILKAFSWVLLEKSIHLKEELYASHIIIAVRFSKSPMKKTAQKRDTFKFFSLISILVFFSAIEPFTNESFIFKSSSCKLLLFFKQWSINIFDDLFYIYDQGTCIKLKQSIIFWCFLKLSIVSKIDIALIVFIAVILFQFV